MFNIMNKKLGRKGFTLIELIVVIAIIAILAVILIPRFSNFTEGAREKAAISDARNILLIVQKLEAEGKLTADSTLEEILALDTNQTNFGGEFDDAYEPGSGTFDYNSDQTYTNGTIIQVPVSGYQIGTPIPKP